MNYRHAFHAGNAADCAKHALLVWIVDALMRKPAPVFVLDTHAGIGRYDLLEGPAERTGEWRDGIARLLHEPPAVLARYVGLVAGVGGPGFVYPGSPLLVASLLRAGDRLQCCELHPEDAAVLRRLFGRDGRVGVHERDGYEAVRALLPPAERRGLVLIDPPYEVTDEAERLLGALRDGAARFAHGVYAAWYPIKHRSPVTTLHESVRLAGLSDVVAAEMWLRPPTDAGKLNGSGLLVRNPPYGFEAAAAEILAAIASRLGAEGAGCQVLRITDE